MPRGHDVITRPLPLYSHRYRLDADLHLPDDEGAAAPYAVVIAASGYQGLKVLHPERFARALTRLRPRVPASVTRLRPRVTDLQSEALGGGRLGVVAFIEDGERRYALPVRPARTDNGWRVVGLGG